MPLCMVIFLSFFFLSFFRGGGGCLFVCFLQKMHLKMSSSVFSVLCVLCLCVRLFVCALWSPAGKGLTFWLTFVVSNCEFVAFPLVS